MTKFVRLSEKGSQVCWEVDEEGNRCVGDLDEWGNLIDRYGRVYVDDVVGVGDVEKHGRCYTKVEGVLLRDRVRKGLVRTYLDGISVGDVYKNGVTKRCGEVITIIQSTYRRFARRSLSEMITPTDKMKKSIIHNLSQQLFINDWNGKCPRLPRSEEIVVSDGIGKISLRKVVRDHVRVVDISKKRVTHKIVDWVRLLDADVRERISEYGLRVWRSLDEVGSYVGGRLDEWGMVVEERVTHGGGLRWLVTKRFSEVMSLGDGVVKRPVRRVGEVIGIVEKRWVEVGKKIGDSVGVVDGVIKRPWKVYGEIVGVEDVEGSRWIGKVLRDGVRVRDEVGKRVRLVRVEIVSVVDEGRSVIGKVLREVVYVVDEKRSSVVRLLGDVVGVVDGGWRHVKRVVSDGIGVEDGKYVVAGKRVFDSVGIDDVVGPRFVGKIVTDSIVVKDRVKKNVVHVGREVIALLDGSVRWLGDEWGKFVTTCIDEYGQRVVGGLNEIGDWVGEKITHGGALVVVPIKCAREVVGLNDEIGGRSVGKRISEIVHVSDKVVKRVVRDLVGEVIGVTDDVKRRGIVKVREMLVLGDRVGKRCEKVLRDSVGVVDYVRRRYEEIVMLVDNIGVVDSVKRQVGYNLRDDVGVSDVVRKGVSKRVGDVINIGETIGREVVKRVRDVMRLKDVVRKRPERVIGEIIGISDWFRRVRDCVIGWRQAGVVKRMSDGIARRRYQDVESVDENRKGEVGR